MSAEGSRLRRMIDRRGLSLRPFGGLPIRKMERPRLPLMDDAGPSAALVEPEPAILGRAGSFIVRLAREASEIEAAQRLRQTVFSELRPDRPVGGSTATCSTPIATICSCSTKRSKGR